MTAFDWDAVATRAEHERLAPLLYVALRESAAPVATLARLRSAWMAAERQQLLAGRQLTEILEAFATAGLAAIVLKGPALASEYYADPALRPFTDLDLLVRRRDRERAIEVLAGLGYVHGSPGRSLGYELDHAPAAYFVTPSDAARLPVDLHWELVCHPGGSRAAELTAEEIWARARPTTRGGESGWTLAAEDLLIYLAAHFAIHHAFAGPLWQLDLALVLGRHGATLDWDAVVTRSQRWRAGAAVYFAVRSIADQLGVAAPMSTLTPLRPGRGRVAVMNRLLQGAPERRARLEYLVSLLVTDSGGDVARMLVSALVPAPRWLRARYDTRSILAAYATHYGRVVRIFGRVLGSA